MFRLVTFLTIILTAQSVWSISIEDCPAHLARDIYLKAYDQSCYQFVTYRLLDYENAERECWNNGGLLVRIKAQHVQNFIITNLQYNLHNHHPIWIGLDDRQHEGTFVWSDHSRLEYSHFHHINHGGHQHDHDCVAIHGDHNGWWYADYCRNDFSHHQDKGFICEYQPVTTTRPQTTTTEKTTQSTPVPTTHLTTEATTTEMPTSETQSSLSSQVPTERTSLGTPTERTEITTLGTPTEPTERTTLGTPTEITERTSLGTPTETTERTILGTPTETTTLGTPTEITWTSSTEAVSDGSTHRQTNAQTDMTVTEAMSSYSTVSPYVSTSVQTDAPSVGTTATERTSVLYSTQTSVETTTIGLDQCPRDLPRDVFLQTFWDSCFVFHVTQMMDYTSAEHACHVTGGTLAVANSELVQRFLIEALLNTYDYRSRVWIGLTDRSTEGTYVWADGSDLDENGFTAWGTNEGPGDLIKTTTDCFALDPNNGGTWHGYECTSPDHFFKLEKPFVCQYRIDGTAPTQTFTTTDLPLSTTQGDQKTTFETSDYETTLSSLPTQETSSSWQTQQLTTVSPNPIFSTSANADPSTSLPLGESTSDNPPTARPISLEDCPANLARDKYLHINDQSCYEFITYRLFDYTTAQEECRDNGGALVVIKSKEVQNFVTDNLKNLGFHSNVWIGLNDQQDEGTFFWSDGSKLGFSDFTNWNLGEGPMEASDLQQQHDCVALQANLGGTWFTDWCENTVDYDTEKGLVCEYHVGNFELKSTQYVSDQSTPSSFEPVSDSTQDATNQPLSTREISSQPLSTQKVYATTFSTSSMSQESTSSNIAPTDRTFSIQSCPGNIIEKGYVSIFRESCFQFNLFSKLSYTNAKQACSETGGILAAIKTKELTDFVLKEMSDHYHSTATLWIGLNDHIQEGVYDWEDGSVWKLNQYSNWAPGTGPFSTSVQRYFKDCVGLVTSKEGRWYDFHCENEAESEKAYICQYTMNSLKKW